MHRCHHRWIQPQQARRHELQVGGRHTDVVRQFLTLGQEGMHVAAGAEILSLAGDQHGAHAAVAMHLHDNLMQRLEQFNIQAVGRFGTVQPDMGHAIGVEFQQRRTVGDENNGRSSGHRVHLRSGRPWNTGRCGC